MDTLLEQVRKEIDACIIRMSNSQAEGMTHDMEFWNGMACGLQWLEEQLKGKKND